MASFTHRWYLRGRIDAMLPLRRGHGQSLGGDAETSLVGRRRRLVGEPSRASPLREGPLQHRGLLLLLFVLVVPWTGGIPVLWFLLFGTD